VDVSMLHSDSETSFCVGVDVDAVSFSR